MGRRGREDNSRGATYRPVVAEDGALLVQVAKEARDNLQNAVDLLLLHNEQPVRGNQPRAVLNQISVLTAVAAWERFVTDIHYLASGIAWDGPDHGDAPRGIGWFFRAENVLQGASAGVLPQAWRLRAWGNYRGKTPTAPYEIQGAHVQGSPGPLGELVGRWIDLRNGVAHRQIPAKGVTAQEWCTYTGSKTVQAGAARQAVALFVQLIDQSLAAVLTVSLDPQTAVDHRLPDWWFAAEPPPGARGLQEPGVLWDGHPLPRRWLQDGFDIPRSAGA